MVDVYNGPMSEEHYEYIEEPSRSNRRIVIAMIAAIVVISAALFVFQNTGTVDINFLFLSGRAPLYVVIIVSMVLGSLLTLIVFGLRRRRRRRAHHEHE